MPLNKGNMMFLENLRRFESLTLRKIQKHKFSKSKKKIYYSFKINDMNEFFVYSNCCNFQKYSKSLANHVAVFKSLKNCHMIRFSNCVKTHIIN